MQNTEENWIIMDNNLNANSEEKLVDTLIEDAKLVLDEDKKICKIAYHFGEIMDSLGLDLNDDSLKGTPKRVAKMFVNEMFSGLDPQNEPQITLFKNNYSYHEMLVEKDITLYSNCEHHFVPIIGKVHVAYIPHGEVIGLSKINRIVQYYAKRPQVQERLTTQISDALKMALKHEDVAVMIVADHLCVAARGIKDTNSVTITESYSGNFEEEATQQRFLSHVHHKV